MAVLTRMEKMLFPGFLLIFEVVFLILYGVLVKYDEPASPVLATPTVGNTTSANGEGEHLSSATVSVISTYPRKLQRRVMYR